METGRGKAKITTIGFTRNSTHPLNLAAYHKILSEVNVKVFGACMTLDEKRKYDKKLHVYCFEEWLKSHWKGIDISQFRKYQEKYNEFNLWEVFYTDRYIRYKYSYTEAVKIILGLIQYWEDILIKENATCIISDCIIGADNFIAMIAGKKVGIPFISIVSGRSDKYKSFFARGEGYLNDAFEQMMAKGYIATEEEKNKTEAYINSYIQNKKQPAYMMNSAVKSYGLKTAVYLSIKKLRHINYLFDPRFKDKCNTLLYKRRSQCLQPAIESIRGKLIRKYFQKPDDSEEYVLYPLHFQPEASTCVYARKYENQLFLIEELSKSIPAGTVLYVKEHSVRLGHRPLSFYKQLRKYPNVKLIAPDINVHSLIKGSKFLIVLTSTAGFEALMHGKPVFVCGNVFYESFSGVKKIKDVFYEKEEFLKPPKQDRESYLNQMSCYLKTLRRCTTMEEPLHEESQENLWELQKQSIKVLLDYLEIPHKGMK